MDQISGGSGPSDKGGGGGRWGMAGHPDPEIRQGVAGAGPGLKNFS